VVERTPWQLVHVVTCDGIAAMIAVGVRELKAALSQAAGDLVLLSLDDRVRDDARRVGMTVA
jgi:hypothetical protein